MNFKRFITTIDGHTEGEIFRVVTSGMPNIRGKTMVEKRDFVSQNLNHLCSALCDEPRGHKSMFVAILTPPVSNNADVGVLFTQPPECYPDMCGHALIGIATLAAEMGIIEPKEPVTEVVFDVPAGTIHARVNVERGKAKSATIQNVPSFLYKTTLIKVPSLGELPVDIAFGGNFFGIVEARDIGIEPKPDDIIQAQARGLFKEIMDSINQQVEVQHPQSPLIKGILEVLISDKPRNPKANTINIAISGDGGMDRSPCGSGTSAKIASLWTKGELNLEETYVTESIIGSLFYAKLIREVRVGNFKAVVPEITGRAFIIGSHTFVIDEDDPFKYGFRL